MTGDVTVEAGDLTADRARVESLRRSLGAHLATYRRAVGLSQPELGQAIGRTRSAVSKVEHGRRGMPARLWKIADDVCGAQGALIAEHSTLARAEQDYRACCRARGRQVRQAGAQAEVEALRTSPASSLAVRQRHRVSGDVAWPDMAMVLVNGELAEEFMQVVTKLVGSVGRRGAMRMLGWALATVGVSGLDPDEYTRIAQAVESPRRVDAQVINNLATTLAYCKRQEDQLGPCEVLDTVVAQHGLVRRLLGGGCPERLRKPLRLVDSNMASAIGGYLIDMGDPDAARGYFQRARRAGHEAGNPAYAAYAAANATLAAFLRGDTCTALDMAAAARSLAARTDDVRLKALAEQMAAAAYALDGQYGPCMAACARAQQFLAGANGCTPDSLAYWVTRGTLDSQRSIFLCLLDRPREAVEAATNARTAASIRPVGYAHSEIRLGHALVLAKDITEAAQVLGTAANHAHLYPRLTQELHTTRALMQPWENTPAVKTLDAQLHACGLLPAHQVMASGLGTRYDQRA